MLKGFDSMHSYRIVIIQLPVIGGCSKGLQLLLTLQKKSKTNKQTMNK